MGFIRFRVFATTEPTLKSNQERERKKRRCKWPNDGRAHTAQCRFGIWLWSRAVNDDAFSAVDRRFMWLMRPVAKLNRLIPHFTPIRFILSRGRRMIRTKT